MKAKITLLLLTLIFSLTNLRSQTVISQGDVYGDWYLTGSPYLIAGDIHLPPAERLRIYPGVVIIFQGQYGFEIEGKLEALGTVNDSITFTFYDTTGFANNNFTGWNGLNFSGTNYSFSDSTIILYCNIEYSGSNGITCQNYSFMIISNSDIRLNGSCGLALYERSDIVVNQVMIRDNKSKGITSVFSSPKFSGFLIENNGGTGIQILGNSSINYYTPTFVNGKILNNCSGSNGGGISLDMDAFAYFEEIIVKGNKGANGGGIYCGMAVCQLQKVEISGNSATNGGGIYGNAYSDITLNNSLLVRNNTDQKGGGAYIKNGKLTMSKSTVSVNAAGTESSGLLFDCVFSLQSSIINSIVYDNVAGDLDVLANAPVVSFSDIKGGFPGIGNIDADPLFFDPVNDDYRLSWVSFPTETGDKSPCIDAGDPSAVYDPDFTICDMGAFYFHQLMITGVMGNTPEININVYPNPAQNYLNISGNMEFNSVVIYNLTGEMVLHSNYISNSGLIDISDFNVGIYLVQIYSDHKLLKINKVIKK